MSRKLFIKVCSSTSFIVVNVKKRIKIDLIINLDSVENYCIVNATLKVYHIPAKK